MVRQMMLGAVVLSASILQTAAAQDSISEFNTRAALNTVTQQAPVQQTGHEHPSASGIDQGDPGYSGGSYYPRLNAPLYPSPMQSTQPWTGGTIITNQALAPHEMLYPHKYHAMYPPFYYQVKGCWLWTPFGMRQHEHWKLQGTQVKVNYRSAYAPFSGFHPKH